MQRLGWAGDAGGQRFLWITLGIGLVGFGFAALIALCARPLF
jgi:hypothetical protein